jgi:hypothetical protein
VHPFPPVETLQPFVGDAVVQVWLDPWGVRLLFESKSNIYVQGDLEQVEADGTLWAYDCKAEGGPPVVLHRLLYKRIVGTEREDFRFTLHMEGGASLAILTDEGPYECGHIFIADKALIVF